MTAVTYPPLDQPKAVAEDLWIVDSGPMKAMGLIPLPVRMTVIRLQDGSLLLHSPTRHDAALEKGLRALGPIRHIVLPNISHWTFLADWQRAFPEAITWAAPGLRDRRQVRKAGVRLDRDLGNADAPDWPPVIDQILVPGMGGFTEVALFHTASRTLVLADLVQNFEREKLPAIARPFAAAAGILAPHGRAPAYLRMIVKAKGAPAQEAGARIVAMQPDRVIFAHGRWFDTDAGVRLARALRWLTG